MRKRSLMAAVASVLLFSGVTAGASALVLDGSDTAPGTGKGEAMCAGPLTVNNPVAIGLHDNIRVEHVDVHGNMKACVGQTMLVEVDLPAGEHAYAVHVFGEDEMFLSFVFDDTTGDFYDTMPLAVDGTLQVQGDRLEPQHAKNFGLVTITIASRWE